MSNPAHHDRGDGNLTLLAECLRDTSSLTIATPDQIGATAFMPSPPTRATTPSWYIAATAGMFAARHRFFAYPRAVRPRGVGVICLEHRRQFSGGGGSYYGADLIEPTGISTIDAECQFSGRETEVHYRGGVRPCGETTLAWCRKEPTKVRCRSTDQNLLIQLLGQRAGQIAAKGFFDTHQRVA